MGSTTKQNRFISSSSSRFSLSHLDQTIQNILAQVPPAQRYAEFKKYQHATTLLTGNQEIETFWLYRYHSNQEQTPINKTGLQLIKNMKQRFGIPWTIQAAHDVQMTPTILIKNRSIQSNKLVQIPYLGQQAILFLTEYWNTLQSLMPSTSTPTPTQPLQQPPPQSVQSPSQPYPSGQPNWSMWNQLPQQPPQSQPQQQQHPSSVFAKPGGGKNTPQPPYGYPPTFPYNGVVSPAGATFPLPQPVNS
jgi:hypothetical protein